MRSALVEQRARALGVASCKNEKRQAGKFPAVSTAALGRALIPVSVGWGPLTAVRLYGAVSSWKSRGLFLGVLRYAAGSTPVRPLLSGREKRPDRVGAAPKVRIGVRPVESRGEAVRLYAGISKW